MERWCIVLDIKAFLKKNLRLILYVVLVVGVTIYLFVATSGEKTTSQAPMTNTNPNPSLTVDSEETTETTEDSTVEGEEEITEEPEENFVSDEVSMERRPSKNSRKRPISTLFKGRKFIDHYSRKTKWCGHVLHG